jgi:hypothetical protein
VLYILVRGWLPMKFKPGSPETTVEEEPELVERTA